MGTLAEDAHALMAATADVAGEKVAEARERLSVALENAKKSRRTGSRQDRRMRESGGRSCS